MPTCPHCGADRPEVARGPCRLSEDGTAYTHETVETITKDDGTRGPDWVVLASAVEADEQPTMVDASYQAYGQPAEATREEDAEAEPEAKPAKKSKGRR